MATTYDVFLSHASLDDDLAEDVRTLLAECGITVFTTPASIRAGKWEQQIEDALQESKEVWVLPTPNAIAESAWVHQELAYFYGYRHGLGQDRLGEHARYMFQEGTPRPGLYDHLQGTAVEHLGNPAEVAGTIASSLGKTLTLPKGREGRSYEIEQARPDSEDSTLFDEQLSKVSGQVVARIRGGGHWQVVIRPSKFHEERVPYNSLYSEVQASHVRHIGWDFPSMDPPSVIRGPDYVGEDFAEGGPNEAWRLYQSGQFVLLSEFSSDIDPDVEPERLGARSVSEIFGMHSCVHFLTMAVEFAVALSQTEAGDDRMLIQISAFGLGGRVLAVPGGVQERFHTDAPSFSHEVHITRNELSARPRDIAVEVAGSLLERFGFYRPDALRTIQDLLLR